LFNRGRRSPDVDCLLSHPEKVKYSATSFSHYQSLQSKGTLPKLKTYDFWSDLVDPLLTWVTAHKALYEYQDLVDKREQVLKLKKIQYVFDFLEEKN